MLHTNALDTVVGMHGSHEKVIIYLFFFRKSFVFFTEFLKLHYI